MKQSSYSIVLTKKEIRVLEIQQQTKVKDNRMPENQ
jgi:hypothetical protein